MIPETGTVADFKRWLNTECQPSPYVGEVYRHIRHNTEWKVEAIGDLRIRFVKLGEEWKNAAPCNIPTADWNWLIAMSALVFVRCE